MNFDLNSYPKDKQFDVPEGYFDNLSDQIFAAVKKADQKQMLLKKRLFYSISVAASLTLLLVAGFLFFNLKNGENIDSPLAQNTPETSFVDDTSNTQEVIQYESLLAQNQIPQSMSTPADEPKPMAPKNNKGIKTANETIANNSEDELDDIDYQIIENYSNEIVFNDWWEL